MCAYVCGAALAWSADHDMCCCTLTTGYGATCIVMCTTTVSADGKHLTSSSLDRTAIYWDLGKSYFPTVVGYIDMHIYVRMCTTCRTVRFATMCVFLSFKSTHARRTGNMFCGILSSVVLWPRQ